MTSRYIEEWDLYGLSYGTDLALNIMRDSPAGIRAVVLDSVYPPQVNALDDEIYATYWAVRQILRGCSQYPPCAEAYPNLEVDLNNAVSRLSTDPVSAADLNLQQVFSEEFDGSGLLELSKFIFAKPYAAAIIDAIANEPVTVWGPYVNSIASGLLDEPPNDIELSIPVFTGIEGRGADGMSNSIICAEELPPANPPFFDLSVTGWSDDVIDQLRRRNKEYPELCEIWSVPVADSAISLPVNSDIPTLILAGTADATTILPFAIETQNTLSNSFLIRVKDAEHGVIDAPCVAEVTLAFLASPESDPVQPCSATTHLVNYEPGLPDPGTIDIAPGEVVSLYGDLLEVPASVFDTPDAVAFLNIIADNIAAALASNSIEFTLETLDNGARYTSANYDDPAARAIASEIIGQFDPDEVE